MVQRRFPDTVLAMTMMLLAQMLDLHLPAPVTGKKVNCKAGQKRNRHFYRQDLQNDLHSHIFGDHDRKHLVGSRQKNSQQRSRRDDPARIQIGSHRRKAALRKNTQHTADRRAACARAADGLLHLLACPVLQIFHRKIGQKKKRKQLNAVYETVHYCIYDHKNPRQSTRYFLWHTLYSACSKSLYSLEYIFIRENASGKIYGPASPQCDHCFCHIGSS